MTVRIGMIGAGIIAHRHLGNLVQMPDVELVGIADVVPDKAAAYAAEFRTRPFYTAEQMIDATQPDALYICIPPFAHGAPDHIFDLARYLLGDVANVYGAASHQFRPKFPHSARRPSMDGIVG